VAPGKAIEQNDGARNLAEVLTVMTPTASLPRCSKVALQLPRRQKVGLKLSGHESIEPTY